MGSLMVADKETLGQIFTSPSVAQLMVNLIKPYLNKDSGCLDPCIGKNVFLKEISKHKYGKLVGVEFDETLIDSEISDFFDMPCRQLVVGDFFDLALDRKFDVIIMNPPYVRQELLNGGVNSKMKVASVLRNDYSRVPGQSNLYVYFLLKALKHLKENGVLVAIIYDSWLFTDFGHAFKNVLFNCHSLEKLVHFRTGAFDNVNVGATILLISSKNRDGGIDYYPFDSPADLSDDGSLPAAKRIVVTREHLLDFNKMNNSTVDFSADIFQPVSKLSDKPIVRGLSGLVNKFFIFEADRFPPHTKKIIKDVMSVKRFEVNGEYKYLLKLAGDVKEKKVNNYLESIRAEVEANPDSYRSLKSCIKHSPDWYAIRGDADGNIIFNYYMRDNPHFIHNPKKYLVADNFYNLSVTKNVYAHLCVLNSSFTKLALFKFGKSQGRGLFKIQLGKFKSMPVINLDKLSKETVKKMENIGKTLCQTERLDSAGILREIDELLLPEVNLYLKKKINMRQLSRDIESIKGN